MVKLQLFSPFRVKFIQNLFSPDFSHLGYIFLFFNLTSVNKPFASNFKKISFEFIDSI